MRGTRAKQLRRQVAARLAELNDSSLNYKTVLRRIKKLYNAGIYV